MVFHDSCYTRTSACASLGHFSTNGRTKNHSHKNKSSCDLAIKFWKSYAIKKVTCSPFLKQPGDKKLDKLWWKKITSALWSLWGISTDLLRKFLEGPPTLKKELSQQKTIKWPHRIILTNRICSFSCQFSESGFTHWAGISTLKGMIIILLIAWLMPVIFQGIFNVSFVPNYKNVGRHHESKTQFTKLQNREPDLVSWECLTTI